MRSDFEPIQDLSFSHSARADGPVDVVWLPALRQRRLARPISAPNRLDFHMIQFVTSGSGSHWVDFEEVTLVPGDLHHVRPGQVHAFEGESVHEALLLFYRPDALGDSGHLIESVSRRLHDVLHPSSVDFAFLTSVLHAQHALDHGHGALRSAQLGPSLLRVILGAIETLLAGDEAGVEPAMLQARNVVSEFEDLVGENYTKARSLNWYAARLNRSERTIARACKRLDRPTPKRLIDQRTLLEARRLLGVTGESVERVAHTLGFSESTNFVKFFRRVSGQTPEAFRRSVI